MSELDALPPDQRAAVTLILTQGRSYHELAGTLGINADAVQARAHAALDTIGPATTRGLTAERRGQLADYLLGQQDAGHRKDTRDYLATSASARAWARVVVGELQ